jgi:hypothetical protein
MGESMELLRLTCADIGIDPESTFVGSAANV